MVENNISMNWIDCNDDKPQKNSSVFIYSKNGGVAEGEYKGNDSWIQYRWGAKGVKVTHWQPLIAGPKTKR